MASHSPTENKRRQIRIKRRKINQKLDREAKIAKKAHNEQLVDSDSGSSVRIRGS